MNRRNGQQKPLPGNLPDVRKGHYKISVLWVNSKLVGPVDERLFVKIQCPAKGAAMAQAAKKNLHIIFQKKLSKS